MAILLNSNTPTSLCPLLSQNNARQVRASHKEYVKRHRLLHQLNFKVNTPSLTIRRGVRAHSSSSSSPKIDHQQRKLSRSGSKRPELKLPGLALRVLAKEIVGKREMLDFVGAVVSEGVSVVILEDDNFGGGLLYEAAVSLKDVIKGRAYLLVSERVDIAAAAGVSGVVLSDDGLPVIVARDMLETGRSNLGVAPLVARIIKHSLLLQNVSAADGPDLLLLNAEAMDDNQMSMKEFQNIKLPVFVSFDLLKNSALPGTAYKLLKAGASGLVFSGLDAIASGDNILKEVKLLLSSIELFSETQRRQSQKEFSHHSFTRNDEIDNKFQEPNTGKTLGGIVKKILEEERPLLSRTINILCKAAPKMNEISLLADAVTQLDDLFLLVIVGEFNSGKSTLINALLGKEFLKVGAVPTTNEITFLYYSAEAHNDGEWDKRPSDGHFIQYLPAKLLRQMTLVDTPGTNVILKRQQRLTEEFVPRADLILFVISADRPLSESEVAFLDYIRQWGKKIVFILNKSDIFRDVNERTEVIKFIKDNARQLLGTEEIILYSVSAVSAMEAKISATQDDGKTDLEALSNDPRWIFSGFPELENFLFSFIDMSSSRGVERVRLKLKTPINIANAVLGAAEERVIEERTEVNLDLVSIKEYIGKLKQYQQQITSESASWRRQMRSLIDAVRKRADNLVDSLLQISNVDGATQYILKREQNGQVSVRSNFANEVIGSSVLDAQVLLREYQRWLISRNSVQERKFQDFFKDRWPGMVKPVHIEKSKEQGVSCSLKTLEEFNTQAASILFEQEIREVLIETFGGLGVAGLSASLLTSILPTTIEDFLALVLCSAGGLYGIWKLPQRRLEVKSKVKRTSEAFARHLEDAMQEDLKKAMDDIELRVSCIVNPCKQAAQSKAAHLDELLDEVKYLERNLQTLQRKIQNIHAG